MNMTEINQVLKDFKQLKQKEISEVAKSIAKKNEISQKENAVTSVLQAKLKELSKRMNALEKEQHKIEDKLYALRDAEKGMRSGKYYEVENALNAKLENFCVELRLQALTEGDEGMKKILSKLRAFKIN